MVEKVPLGDAPRGRGGANGMLDVEPDYLLALHTEGNEITLRCSPGVPADARLTHCELGSLNRLRIYFYSEEFAAFVEPGKIRAIIPSHDIIDDDADAAPERDSES